MLKLDDTFLDMGQTESIQYSINLKLGYTSAEAHLALFTFLNSPGVTIVSVFHRDKDVAEVKISVNLCPLVLIN